MLLNCWGDRLPILICISEALTYVYNLLYVWRGALVRCPVVSIVSCKECATLTRGRGGRRCAFFTIFQLLYLTVVSLAVVAMSEAKVGEEEEEEEDEFEDEEEGDTITVVLDNGSGTIKAGFAGLDAPETIFPCITAIADDAKKEDKHIIGNEAMVNIFSPKKCNPKTKNKKIKKPFYLQSSKGMKIYRPIQHGIISDFEIIEEVWEYTFSKL